MSAFSQTHFKSDEYNSFRPTYPPEFLSHVIKYAQAHATNHESLRLLDIGTGPGTTIQTLVHLLPKIPIHIILTDVSDPMLKEAQKNLKELPVNITVEFIKASAEDLLDHIKEPVDLIMATECVHWFDYPTFLHNCHTLLKSGGTLAYWVYVDPVFINDSNATALNDWYEDFVENKPNQLGSYWEPKGRGLLRNLVRQYSDVLLKKDGKDWVDVTVTYLINNKFESYGNKQWGQDLLRIEKTDSLQVFSRYVDTWSSSPKWNAANDENAGFIFIKGCESRIGIKPTDHISWQMKASYALASKK